MTMNILFLTLVQFDNLQEHNIYTDLLQEFVDRGHFVYAISPVERRQNVQTYLSQNDERAKVLRLRIGNTQKTSMIEKGIATVTLEQTFIRAIKKYTADIRFDLVLYSTPPITLCNAVQYVRQRDYAKTYLLLKDIFPQNSLDLGILQTSGIKGVLYRMFRKKEQKLYRISDYIGCMSQANVDYVLRHNALSDHQVIEVNPNCICPSKKRTVSEDERVALRENYGIPVDKCAFLYGGNLGKPQDVRHIVACLRACEVIDDTVFVIAGSGTDRYRLEQYVNQERPQHVILLPQIPIAEYERMVGCCDVGLIFLDHRFTIPNFPSRLLSYMDAGLPVLAATDSNTDVGTVICEGGFGVWCESNGTESFVSGIRQMLDADRRVQMGACARTYLEEHYTARRGYDTIMSHFDKALDKR